MSQQFPFYDRVIGLRYTYDETSDSYIYEDATTRRRPVGDDIPRYVAADRARQSTSSAQRAPSSASQQRAQIPASVSGYSSATSPPRDSSYTYRTTPMVSSPESASAQPIPQSRQAGTRDADRRDPQVLSGALNNLSLSTSAGGSASQRYAIPSQAQGQPTQSRQTQYRQGTGQQGIAAGGGNGGRGTGGGGTGGGGGATGGGNGGESSDPIQTRFQTGGLQVTQLYNPRNEVRTLRATAELNPSASITESSLLRERIRARELLLGSGEGEQERLYSAFKVRPHSFFCVGRVFLILWVEPAGATAVTNAVRNDSFLPGRYQDEFIYSKVRRFVVVRAGEQYCSALPIASYGHQGVGKVGVKKSEHAIIYTGSTVPTPMTSEAPRRGEAGMRHAAIRVVPDDPTDKLDPDSRIDFGKVHTVQHNIKVKHFGMVHQTSMSALNTQFLNVWIMGDALASTQPTEPIASSSQARHYGRTVPETAVNYREAPPETNAPIPSVPRPAPGSQTSQGRSAGSQRSQNITDASVQRTSRVVSTPVHTATGAGSSRGAPSVASADAQRRAQAMASSRVEEEDEDEDEDEESDENGNEGDAQQTRTASSRPAATSMAAEARSAQNAYQALRQQQGYTSEQAVEILVRRFMESNPRISREAAVDGILGRLRFNG